jgi:hypothetical protein
LVSTRQLDYSTDEKESNPKFWIIFILPKGVGSFVPLHKGQEAVDICHQAEGIPNPPWMLHKTN